MSEETPAGRRLREIEELSRDAMSKTISVEGRLRINSSSAAAGILSDLARETPDIHYLASLISLDADTRRGPVVLYAHSFGTRSVLSQVVDIHPNVYDYDMAVSVSEQDIRESWNSLVAQLREHNCKYNSTQEGEDQ